MTTDFFGIEERAAGWPDFRSFQVFPISALAHGRLVDLLTDDGRHEIDTAHPAFGWIVRPKTNSPQLGLPVPEPALLATAVETARFRAAQPAPFRPQPQLRKPVIQVGRDPAAFEESAAIAARNMADWALTYLTALGHPDEATAALAPSLAAAIRAWYRQHFTPRRSDELPPDPLEPLPR